MSYINNDEDFTKVINNHAKTLVKDNITQTVDQQRNSKGQFIEGTWLPGQSGNPAGRKPDIKYISEAIRDLIRKDPELLKSIVLSLAKKAKTGDVPAFKELSDRAEGKVADKIEGTENPVTIILRPARDRG